MAFYYFESKDFLKAKSKHQIQILISIIQLNL